MGPQLAGIETAARLPPFSFPVSNRIRGPLIVSKKAATEGRRSFARIEPNYTIPEARKSCLALARPNFLLRVGGSGIRCFGLRHAVAVMPVLDANIAECAVLMMMHQVIQIRLDCI